MKTTFALIQLPVRNVFQRAWASWRAHRAWSKLNAYEKAIRAYEADLIYAYTKWCGVNAAYQAEQLAQREIATMLHDWRQERGYTVVPQ